MCSFIMHKNRSAPSIKQDTMNQIFEKYMPKKRYIEKKKRAGGARRSTNGIQTGFYLFHIYYAFNFSVYQKIFYQDVKYS